MRKSLIGLIFLFAGTINAAEMRILPEDEADRDLSLLEFRSALIEAVQQKDAGKLQSFLAEDIRVNANRRGGILAFEKHWEPGRKNSELWTVLSEVLNMGGGFLRSERGVRFCAPYTFVNFPADLDVYGHGIVIKDNVALKAGPSQGAATVQKLSYHVVKVADWRSVADQQNSNLRWLQINTLDGKKGYVEKGSLRSPVDYSACFLHTDSTGWKLDSLLANE